MTHPSPQCQLDDSSASDRLTSTAAAALLQLSSAVLDAEADEADVLTRALATATSLIPEVRWASLTRLPPSGRAITPFATDPVARDVDALQYQLHGGPCLESLNCETVIVSDLTDEPRWPAFAEQALETTPVRAVLSYPLTGAGHVGTSLNLYSNQPAGFADADLDRAALTAAGVALALAGSNHRRRAANLEKALVSSRRIGAAVGILMGRHQCRYDEAFDAMCRASQRSHRKLRDIAEDVLVTGALDPTT
jgi:hypothetical protein